jgi:hypothetical protein
VVDESPARVGVEKKKVRSMVNGAHSIISGRHCPDPSRSCHAVADPRRAV